ncbi:hypothetical protein L5C66_28540 [Pseudomonas aeruginosa]|uniref:hypothetical protein n=1 Tax=Pseudomonas aeruginosa TaxID=287 RepID=UPI001F1EA475|nr:hypothetical protein [Pseudomonas aeruginosa]MDG3714351.1 hypothetical protein [Pseudomonas aeruginosa]
MENLTLSAKELGGILKAFFWTALAISITYSTFQIYVMDSEFRLGLALGWFSIGATATTGLFWVFYKWIWRFRIISEFLGRPVLHGVWIGELRSRYKVKDSNPPKIIPIVFIIRQSYLSLSIVSLTRDQEGDSKVEAILHNPRTNIFRLAYVFELRNEFAGEIRLINGAGDLNIEKHTLKGPYWTSSPSHGIIAMRRVSDCCDTVTSFPEAKRKWPAESDWKIQ